MEAKILSVISQNEKIVYNPTVPFESEGKIYIGVRVESLNSELDSQTFFAYKQDTNLWRIDYSLGSFPLQDPAYVEINGEIFILGVRVWQEGSEMKWKQDIYRGNSIKNLKYFTSGPIGMKDIRLVNLEDRVGVFTRPRGNIGGKGKIGYLEVENIDELKDFTEDDWYNAKIIEGLFDDNCWGGVNQAIKLPGGEIGVIGHIAHQTFNEKNELEKHYYGMAFRFNPQTRLQSKFKIIARRNDFPSSFSKRSPELDDIIFPVGIDNANNLYCGLSDFCIGQKKIKNPF
jgi:hypothetical protein